MDVAFEFSQYWLDGAKSNPEWAARQHTAEVLFGDVADYAAAALKSTLVPEISHASEAVAAWGTLPSGLSSRMDIRITIRPPWHDGTWDARRGYMTDILTYMERQLSGILGDHPDAPRILVRVQPVESCEVLLAHGRPVPGSERATIRRSHH